MQKLTEKNVTASREIPLPLMGNVNFEQPFTKVAKTVTDRKRLGNVSGPVDGLKT